MNNFGLNTAYQQNKMGANEMWLMGLMKLVISNIKYFH